MRLLLPHMKEILHRLKGTSRTKSVASRRALMDGDRTPEGVEALNNSREMLMNALS